MATIIELPKQSKPKTKLKKELREFAAANRNPEKALDEMSGIWEGRNISIEKIREQRNRKKW